MKYLAIIALLFSASCAQAKPIATSGELLQWCANGPNTFGMGVCYGYIQGVVDRFQAQMKTDSPKLPATDIVPPHATFEQMRLIVVAYIWAHPEFNKRSCETVILDAFIEEGFKPCNVSTFGCAK